MSDISISYDTVQTMAMDNLSSAPESLNDSSSEISSGLNTRGVDSSEQVVAGLEVASRTEDYLGTGTDFGSTGTDPDIRQVANAAADTGIGMITDKVA